MSQHNEIVKNGHLIVISGPSGVGKGTIINALIKMDSKTSLSVSCTTRKPRPNETEGESYYFINRNTFLKGIDSGNFLEYAEVFGNLYGTPKDKVLDKLKEGKNVLLEIDVHGAQQVKNNYDNTVMIFIMPPSEDILINRLKNRGTESVEQINERISKAKEEISKKDLYDYIIVNDNLDEAIKLTYDIISKL